MQERVAFTMVQAGHGVSFVVKNTETIAPDEYISYAIIDGGPPGTQTNIAAYLPRLGPIAYVFCSHYDSR